MARPGIGEQLVEQIAAFTVPQVMMRIDDRQRRLESILTVLGEPRRVQVDVGDMGQVFVGHVITPRCHPAITALSPTMVVRCMTRRSRGSNAVT